MENQETTKKEDFFTKLQADTAGLAAQKVLKVLGTSDNLFILSKESEDIQKNNEAYEKLLQDVLAIFTECNVGLTNYGFVWSSLKSIVTALEQHMDNHVIGLKGEIISRSVGNKNPFDDKYDVNYATHEQLIQTVLRLREEQGNVPGAEDYFTIEKPNIPSPMPMEELNK